MTSSAPGGFGAQLKSLREASGFTQEELATIAGLSVHAISALERGQRRRPHVDTVRALSAALELSGDRREALMATARAPVEEGAAEELTALAPLPLAATPLVGREEAVHTLRSWLVDPGARFVTLTGPGGVGKTRLALELARTIAEEGATRVVFVPLAPVRQAALVEPAVAEALGVVCAPSQLAMRARAAFGRTPMLLVLDNFEHVLDAAPLVADLLASVPSLRIVATSRAPLRVRGEREYPVDPLTITPAVRLFVERVQDAQPDFRLTDSNAETVTAICRKLDSLPLALELVAPWLKVLNADDLLRRLEQNVLFSSVTRKDLPERQQSFAATVGWSYQLLKPDQQRVFRRLAVLPGSFPIEAAAAVIHDDTRPGAKLDSALIALADLLDKSLLHREEAPGTSRMLCRTLETVRAVAARELEAAGERDAAFDGLVRYCRREGVEAAIGLVGTDQAAWLDRVRDDLDNHRQALAWLIDRRDAQGAADIACGLLWFWVIRGHVREGLGWYSQILALPARAPETELRVLMAAAVVQYSAGDLQASRNALMRARAIAESLNDSLALLEIDCVRGHVEHLAGNADDARAHFARSAAAGGAPAWRRGSALTGLAWVALDAGDLIEAERRLNEATDALPGAGPWFMLLVEFLRATVAVRRGDADATIALVRTSLERIRALRDQFAFLYALVALAAAAALKGNDVWVARVLGARAAVADLTDVGIVDHYLRDKLAAIERDARSRLGQDRWERAYASGRTTSFDALSRDADPEP